MKQIVTAISFVVCNFITAQVGINNDIPKATLDVVARSGSTDIDGLIAPRLTLSELATKGDNLSSTNQNGVILYITDVTSGSMMGQRVNINQIGYYYFDAAENVWQRILNRQNIPVEPWNVSGTATEANLNTQNVYQNANVGIGNFATDQPSTNLDIKGHSFVRNSSGVRGALYFGDSFTTSPDVSLSRTSANNLLTQAVFTLKNNSTSTGTVNLQLFDDLSEGHPSFTVNKNGVIVLGSGEAATNKLKLTGPAYSGATGNRYLLIDPGTGIVSMSSINSVLTTDRSGNPTSLSTPDAAVISSLQDQLKAQADRISQLEGIVNRLISQNPK